MALNPISRSDFYVYALLREDGNPFYIGKGRGERMRVHERQAPRMSSHKDRIIQRMIARGVTEIPKCKLVESLTDAEAKQIEVDLIALLGRYPGGPLVNLTRGGDGVGKLAPESRARKSAANVAAWADPVVRERRLAGIAAVWSPETRRAHALKMVRARQMKPRVARPKKPRKQSPFTRSQIAARLWSDPTFRAKQLAARQARYRKTPLSAEKRKELADRLNSAISISKRTATGNLPDVRERRIAAQRASFSTPEAKAKRSITSRAMWARKKAQYALPSANEQLPPQPPPKHP